jgi:hypothetical protein
MLGVDHDWNRYLLTLATAGPLESCQALRARKLWDSIRPAVGGSPPHAAPLVDGTFSMAWDKGPHHLEVELQPSGLFDWFYLNRATDELAGEEDLPIGTVSASMIQRLRQVAA